jgi:hypothetical protein
MFVLPEVVLQEAMALGINNLKNNSHYLDEIFAQYLEPELTAKYGQSYIDSIKTWIKETKIPVVQAWSFDMTKVPCISIHLGSETEDESKAAMSDFVGVSLDDYKEILSGVVNVTVDIGIHSDKNKDTVIWLYYMICHIIYQQKMLLDKLGLKLVTFSASDYNKESRYMTENIWTRWVRMKCTVQNFISSAREPIQVDSIDVGIEFDESGNPIGDTSGYNGDETDAVNGIGFQQTGDLNDTTTVYHNQD